MSNRVALHGGSHKGVTIKHGGGAVKDAATAWAQKLIEGDLPTKKMRLLQAWISIHEKELMADWALAVKGEPVFKIDPLR